VKSVTEVPDRWRVAQGETKVASLNNQPLTGTDSSVPVAMFRVAGLWYCKTKPTSPVNTDDEERNMVARAHLKDVRLGTGDRAQCLSDEVRDLVQDVDLKNTGTHDDGSA